MEAATPRTTVSVVTTKLVALAVEARASSSAAPNKREWNMVDLLDRLFGGSYVRRTLSLLRYLLPSWVR
ncbi:hypothetical protein D3C75_1299540 [compost metagenome]